MATELGKAYVQIVASADGLGSDINHAFNKDAGKAGDEAGKTMGNNLVGAIKRIIVAAGIGAAFKSAIMEGANLEQALGGVEAIFGDAADTVKANAQAAFATAGVSANQYMEGVTSFAASLLASTGNDTAKAAEVADKAFRDMSDNANRFGTDIGSIQSAYQGFAKQNYTMLDNLKLGYGGTKTEMERLLKDAQALSGVEYNIDNLADVYTAIGVIQDKLNVTGTTAKEGATTFTGALNMMKASASNLLGSLALGENIGPALENLTTSVVAFAQNALRLIGNIITSLPEVIATAVPTILSTLTETLQSITSTLGDKIPTFMATMVPGILSFTDTLMDNIGEFISAGLTLLEGLLSGIISGLPDLIEGAFTLISTFIGSIVDNLPDILQTGVTLLLKFLDGIIDNLPKIAEAALKGLMGFVKAIASNLPTIIKSGIEIIGKLVVGLIQAIPKIVAAIPQIIRSAVNVFKTFDWAGLGKSIIEGIVAGIRNLGHLIGDVLKNLAKSAWQGVKSLLGIGSPSKVFADQVGQWIPAGIAAGIEDNAQVLTNAMSDLTDKTMAYGAAEVQADLQAITEGQGGSIKDVISNLRAQQMTTAAPVAGTSATVGYYSTLEQSLATIIALLREGKVIEIDGRKVAVALGREINDVLGGIAIREARGQV